MSASSWPRCRPGCGFRGAVRGVNEAGLSWAVSRDDAVAWAYHNADMHGDGEPVVVVGAVSRDDIVAFTMNRLEAEVVALPENVSVARVEDAGPDTRATQRKLREHSVEVQSADDDG
jgi:hypothetical protein